ncbi:MAG: GFA family protein [Kangiellaceae bacterium]|nr:GFA family protein [Kangiellaceae bacterium]
MSEVLAAKTKCLCGNVTISAESIDPNFTVCHCDSCRTWGSGPFFAVRCGKDVEIKGDISIYDSSDWANRGFCQNCGTHLFYQLKESGEYNMPVGLFPDLADLEMSMQYFSDKRPDYYCFSNETKQMTEAEIFAYFASQA